MRAPTSANPTRRTSLRSSKPVSAATRSRTCSITAFTSAAVAPSPAWMKLACLSDTKAPPTRKPRRPTRSINSPAESWPGIGLTNTEPAFWPPGWFSRRHLTISAISRSDCCWSPSARSSWAVSTISWSVKFGAAEPEAKRLGRPPLARTGVRRSKTSACTRHAAMSEPCPPAFIRTAPPIDPGTPTAHSKPVNPAAAVRRASTGNATAEPANTSRLRYLDRRRPTRPSSARRRRSRRRRPAGSIRGRRPTRGGRSGRRLGDLCAGRRAKSGLTKIAAEPPTRYVVIGPSGSSTRPSGPRSEIAFCRR